MALEIDLKGHISTISALGSRIHPMQLPQNPIYPALVYQVISGFGERGISSLWPVRRARIQLTVWSKSYDEAISVGKQVRILLDGMRDTIGSTKVSSLIIENDSDTGDQKDTIGAEIKGRRMDALITYSER